MKFQALSRMSAVGLALVGVAVGVFAFGAGPAAGQATPAFDFAQIGDDINGEAEFDNSSEAVAISADGNTVAIGADLNDGNGFSSGHVRVYTNNNGNWQQIGNDINGEAEFDNFGDAVAISADGNTVAIGAPLNDGPNGNASGHVRVYTNNSGNWQQIGNDINGEAAGDFSGGAVSISADGNTVAIGAAGNGGNGDFSGHVRIYTNNNGNWQQIGNDINGEASDDISGGAVSISADGNTVAIGARQNDGPNGNNSGHVRIYTNNNGNWQQIGNDINGEAQGDNSGAAVAISADGNTVAIGAPLNDGPNGERSGHVRVFDISVPTNPPDQPPAGPACTIQTLANGDITLTWTPFNGENDNYQVRQNGSWQAAVPANGPLTYTGSNATDYTIRSNESQTVVDLTCTNNPTNPPDQSPAGPACTVQTLANGDVTLTWTPFNGENDNYQVRQNGSWQAAIPANGPLTHTGPTATDYTIRSREAQTVVNLNCS